VANATNSGPSEPVKPRLVEFVEQIGHAHITTADQSPSTHTEPAICRRRQPEWRADHDGRSMRTASHRSGKLVSRRTLRPSEGSVRLIQYPVEVRFLLRTQYNADELDIRG
jgi:hypothetical protein